jgi:hypothetical protein
LLFFTADAFSQRIIQDVGNRAKQMGGSLKGARQTGGAGQDSLKRRDKNEDSITVRFRYLDSTGNYMLDSSINDFTKRFPIPATNVYLGNTGTASRSILFSPLMNPGWDPGFHAFDVYKWSIDRVRFFNTTRPYSELNYVIASRYEQTIELLHTQNIKPNWNFLAQYRLINAPGFYKNQKTNHNNYLFTTWYQTVNKRYNAYLVLLSNNIDAGENGGIDTITSLKDPDYKDRFQILTKIGGSQDYTTNFFSTDVGTGNRYREFTVLLRQQYDFGQKDSLVTDSTVIPLFYPRLRFEHTLQYTKSKYNFRDYVADTNYYKAFYDTLDPSIDSFEVQDEWRELVNDFSIYQYPDAKNLHQFFKVGAALQNLSLDNIRGSRKFHNTFGHAEYRNRTRNQKWDIRAKGILYFTGLNAGDYKAYASLQRSIGKRAGYIQFAFENVNRTPSFINDPRSNFYLMKTVENFNKENTTHISATIFQPSLKLKLEGHYYLLTNYTYVTDFYKLQQEGTLFNMVQVGLQKTFNVGRRFRWHADVYVQQRIGNAPVNVPTVFTRHRFAYEGSLGFKNLDMAAGIEARYHTSYKADNYSPVLGQFFYQNSTTIEYARPDIHGYIHFRIRSFKLYFRAENLNTAQVQDKEFGWTLNNLAAPDYPYPGFILRFGIYWSFVN